MVNITEEQKSRLRGAIKYFSGDRCNVKIEVIDSGVIKPCGGIFLNDKVKGIFEEIVGKDNVKLD